MSTGNIGGLDFSKLIGAAQLVASTLSQVQTRLANVAPQAGSTDPAASAAAQDEINSIASQLADAVASLNQVNNAAQAAASPADTAATGAVSPANPAPGTPAAPAAPDVISTTVPAPGPSEPAAAPDTGAPLTGGDVTPP